MKRPELLLLPIALGFAAFIAVQARDAAGRRPVAGAAPAEDTGNATTTAALAIGDADHTNEAAVESSAPPPARDLAQIRRQLASGEAGTYIGAVLAAQDSMLIRWPDRGFDPLNVWVEPVSTIADFDVEYPALAREAFSGWLSAEIPMSFTFVADSSRAAVHVLWLDRFEGDARIGSTRRTHDQHGWIVDADITLALHDSSGAALSRDMLRAAALHEVGHLLGLAHSADSADIMFSSATPLTRDITRVDRATARLLYLLPPGPVRDS